MLSGTTIQKGSETTLTQENIYNGGGQRVSKDENGTATNYFYQDGSVLYTTDSSGAKTTQNFLTTAGSTMATARYGTSDISYYTYNKDIRNSTVSILDETGAVATKYSYDEFGQTTVDGNYTFANEICYTGGIYDWSTGQYYLNARYYDPETGRFLSEDTYRGVTNEPNSWHLYAYCANNPVNYVDPSGHKTWGIQLVIPKFFLSGFAYASDMLLRWNVSNNKIMSRQLQPYGVGSRLRGVIYRFDRAWVAKDYISTYYQRQRGYIYCHYYFSKLALFTASSFQMVVEIWYYADGGFDWYCKGYPTAKVRRI